MVAILGIVGIVESAAISNEATHGSPAARAIASGNDIPHTGCAAGTRAAHPKRGRDLVAGPVAFLGLVSRNGEAVADSGGFEREPGERYTGFKSGASVKRGAVATIVVPRSERPELKIDYALGDPWGFASTLQACDDRRTGFPGGFQVHGPLCTKLRVRVEGRKRPITKPVSFGAGKCPP